MVFKKGHKINLGRKGIPVSEETRRKISEAGSKSIHFPTTYNTIRFVLFWISMPIITIGK
ncbi:MAG: hypothetical protein EX285_08900 [Thaumarchaeota archaeon]|nr:hypothetical protein [Nitrososphaerota archaeon]